MACLDDVNSTTLHFDRFRAILDYTIIALIILGNSFIIYAVIRGWRQHGMPLEKICSTYLVINLSIADALVGAFSIFYFLPRYLCSLSRDLGHDFVPCILRFSPVIMAHLVSGYSLIVIAVDRYIAVIYAVRYPDIVTKKRTLAAIGIIWGTAIFVSFVLFLWNDWNLGEACNEFIVLPIYYVLIGGLFGQFIIMGVVSFTHWKIHQVAMHIRNRNEELSISAQIHTKSARALLIIVGVYAVTWSPFMILLIIKLSKVLVPDIALELASSLVNVNYLINPHIYAYSNRPVRRAMSHALKRFKLPNPFYDPTSATASKT